MESLEKLKKIRPKMIYPGHGPMIDNGLRKIEEYIEHRQVNLAT
jgi:ribonuclease/clavin/mitogillin